jgi:putative flavoprotein involved in K+ transport
MAFERTTETVVVGGGQAGLALSRYLSAAGRDHVVLERGRVGERWRSERWDSLTLLTPAWMSALPDLPHDDPDAFLTRGELVAYLERYARTFAAPVLDGTSVLRVAPGHGGFAVDTDRGSWRARNVVVASGDGAAARVPAVAAGAPTGLRLLHSSRYRSPGALPDGAVLVVGAGPSGQQIALELARSGREVWLAVGRHARAPRRYRGADLWRWLHALGHPDETVEDVTARGSPPSAPGLPLSGANGGERIDLGVLQDAGVALTGRVMGFDGERAFFGPDLHETVAEADERLRTLLDRIDAHVRRAGIGAPAPDPPPPVGVVDPPEMLDLRAAGVSSVVWATGFGRSHPWLRVPGIAAESGIAHRRGLTPVRGLYALGLRRQHRRSSHMIGGVGRDAEYIASRIVEAPRSAVTRRLRSRRSAPALRRALAPAFG